MKKIIYDDNGTLLSKDIMIFEKPELMSILNKTSWKILELLSIKESYPLQIAKELKINEQKVYYYIKKLSKAGFIEVTKKREVKGALAKLYSTSSNAFGIELKSKGVPLPGMTFAGTDENLRKFFSPFTQKGKFNAYLVLGAPDPHGPMKTWARDSHYSNYLTSMLGSFVDFEKKDFVRLDVEIKSGNLIKENLIVIGGPAVNVITSDLNQYLKIRITGESKGEAPNATFSRELYSEITKKSYKEENVGYIIRTDNPFNKNNSILVLAGLGKEEQCLQFLL